MEPHHYAFVLAYKCWLECDAHYHASLRGNASALDADWLRHIGRIYLFNRNVAEGAEAPLIDAVVHAGQGNDMNIEERAARLSNSLRRRGVTSASAASKLSWFIWPSGWTMYDRLAREAVIGVRTEPALEKFERFYVALAMRGWNDLLSQVRQCIREGHMETMLAERTIDKFLMLNSYSESAREQLVAALNNFLKALPGDLRDTIVHVDEQISTILVASQLLHRNTATDRAALAARLAQFNQLKQQVA
jgi:hypothetical protein